MELCWLCAWANFLIVSTSKISVPLAVLCAAFFMALVISDGFKTKGHRIIWMLLGHVLGLCLIISVAFFAGIGWIFPQTVYQWYQMALMGCLVCFFWYRGIRLSGRQRSYKTTCNYFDQGVSLFFALLIIKMVIQIKGGKLVQESLTLYLMGGYFFFGLAAVFFSQNTTIQKKIYVTGFRVYGVLISVVSVLLFWGMGLVFVLLPFMTGFAQSGYRVLKQVAGPLTPYLISVLRFIFSVRNRPGNSAMVQQGQGIPDPHITLVPVQNGWMEQAFSFGILAIFFLLGVVMVAYIIHLIFKFLMSKQAVAAIDKEDTLFFSWVKKWLVWVIDFLKKIILALGGTVENGRNGFIRLLRWGRKSGMPKLQTETAAEYAKRLQQQFEPLENDIRTIVCAFEQETYGEMILDTSKLSHMAKALKTIHSPIFWPLRIRSFWKML